MQPEQTPNRAGVPEDSKKAVQQQQQPQHQQQKREQNQGPNPTQAASNASPQQPSSMLLKRMQKKAATAKRAIAYDPFPPVGTKVAISSVSNKLLYIHEVNDAFLSLVTRCIKHADEIDETLQQPPHESDIVFAPFDDCYYRAVVTKVEGNNSTVMFPDFGNVLTLPWSEMKEIRDVSVKYANCLTHAVALREGAPFSAAVEQFLNELVEAHQFELTLVEDGPTPGVKTVELRHVESQYLLGAKVRSMTTPAVKKAIKLEATDPATYKPVYDTEFDDTSIRSVIQQHEEHELVIVEASELENKQIAAIFAKSEVAFANMMRECQEYGQLDRNEYFGEPEVNYGCLVNYEGAWVRAIRLTSDCENQFFLLDLGLVCQLDSSCPKRRYPPGLTRKLFCSEFVVENIEFLKKEMKGTSNLTDSLRGLKLKAKVFFDEETEAYRIKIISIIKR
ncbi:AGAP012952-PA-like protein [Anopheles sinensis]|uniref:AGAP012952-PA-like protein n=1 Tax=Anopheles sinensis TaxID=74873 RepID=A0A084VVV5_ANOSI|nr:AGAP012952-PA-like protein [Anopheles sinensis]